MKNSTELKGHAAAIERVAFNPTKDAELASVSGDGTCRFWDVRNKQCVAVVSLGGEGLTVAWAGDGSVVMVGRKVYMIALPQTRKIEKKALPSSPPNNITLYNHTFTPLPFLFPISPPFPPHRERERMQEKEIKSVK